MIKSGAVTRVSLKELEAEYRYKAEMKDAVAKSMKVDEQFQSKQIEQLKAANARMEKNIDIARSNLENLTLKAPIDGQLTKLEANQGETKARGERVGQIDDISSFKVTAMIDEYYLSRVQLDQKALVNIDGKESELTVSKIYPEVENRQFKIDLIFTHNTPKDIRRGQTMRLRLEIGDSAETLVVGNGAFYETSRGLWAFVLDKEGKSAERRPVQLGRRNPDSIEVTGGLSAGEKIIISSYEAFGNSERLIIDRN
jgi:HlyD family secretion protein